MLNLPHADTHAVVLPHALAYNAPAVPAVAARIAAALDVGDAAQGLYDLTQCLDVPVSLRALGVAESELDRVADAALLAPYPNPRELTRDGVRALLQDAWSGQRPDHTSQ